MKQASTKGFTAKPKKIRITVALEPETLAILEEWEKRYGPVGKRDRFINGAIEFMKSQDITGIDANYHPFNPLERKRIPIDHHPSTPRKPGRILRLVPPSATQKKGA
jgi:hypothetical protein